MNDIIYIGTIITMNDAMLYAEAMHIQNGRISEVGTLEEVMKTKNENTKVIELKDQILFPGFIDGHSHLCQFSQTLGIAMLNGATDFGQIKERLEAFKKENGLDDSAVLIGFGYDHNQLKEGRHPRAKDLDAFELPNPILVTHQSGHMGSLSSKTMKLFGLDSSSSDISGGVIERDDLGNPTGYLEEKAFIAWSGKVPAQTDEQRIPFVKKAQKTYASYGVTTAQEGFIDESAYSFIEFLRQHQVMELDLIGYLDAKTPDRLTDEKMQYQNHIRYNGYKTFFDGSPQGRTAWMSKPYEGTPEYSGYSIYTDDQAKEIVDTALSRGRQLLTHCNGDAAAAQLIHAFKSLIEEKKYQETYRPVMIHAQTLRPDQVPELKEIGMIPSYFVTHVKYWGETHIKNFGIERAQNISPLKTTVDCGMRFTLHQDTPVLLPNQLELVQTAVTRRMNNQKVLGEEQRITVMEALKAITVYGAYVYGEEDIKGTLEVGKLADFVILSGNPLTVDENEIDQIQVLETVKEGCSIYRK